MDWSELASIEPRLKELEREVLSIKGGKRFCANAVWYGYDGKPSYRERLTQLVGWGSDDSRLTGEAAYDAAYEHLYGLLPDCTHDGPLC